MIWGLRKDDDACHQLPNGPGMTPSSQLETECCTCFEAVFQVKSKFGPGLLHCCTAKLQISVKVLIFRTLPDYHYSQWLTCESSASKVMFCLLLSLSFVVILTAFCATSQTLGSHSGLAADVL